MTKNTRPWHSSMFVTTVMTTLDGQDPEAMSNFIYKIQTEYLDDTYETFGSSKYRSKTDDSLISDIKKAKSLLDKFDKIAIFDMQKLLHTRSCDYNLLQVTSAMLGDMLDLNASLHSGSWLARTLSYLKKIYQEYFPKLSTKYTRGALITTIGAALLGKERLPNGVEKQITSTKLA